MQSIRRALPLQLRIRGEQKLVRLLTLLAARFPWMWKLCVPAALMRGTFDPMASSWDRRVAAHSGEWAAPLLVGLEEVRHSPARALDIGTGTGLAASIITRRFPHASVTGVDISPAMIAQAQRTHAGVPNLRFVVADSYSLPFNDAGFDLVTCLNAPPFFVEIARLTAAGGVVLICFSLGKRTPIYLPATEVESNLARHSFGNIKSGHAGQGVWTLAEKL